MNILIYFGRIIFSHKNLNTIYTEVIDVDLRIRKKNSFAEP